MARRMSIPQHFDQPVHRTQSASAVFQRGIYHLFTIERRTDCDVYSSVVRSYQAVYQLCLAILLLDFTYTLRGKQISKRLRARCADVNAPTCAEIDPAAVVTHSIFENRKWSGPPHSSPLRNVAARALDLINRVVEARHNLIYRPFLLNREGPFWEDCSLQELLHNIPRPDEINAVYQDFIDAVLLHRQRESEWIREIHRSIRESPHRWRDHMILSGQKWADYFMQLQFWPYEDEQGRRPTETILLSYARTLTGGDESLLCELRRFRNALLRLSDMQPPIRVEPEWRPGEI
jgi:hypothetical protein